MAFDAGAVGIEGDALRGDDSVEVGEAVKVPVDDRLVEVDPERLDRLELGGVGRQVNEADPRGYGETRRAVPAGVVEHEEDDAVRSGACLPGEECEDVLEVLLGDAGGEIPEALAGGGRDEGGDVEPFEAVVSDRDGPLAARRPDAAQDRLQTDAVLVGGEGLDYCARMALRLLGGGLGELFLNSACASGPAALA